MIYYDTLSNNPSINSVFALPSAFAAMCSAFKVLWDSGASISISNNRNDFVEFSSNPVVSRCRGIGSGAKVEGQGIVEWNIKDVHGHIRVLRLRALYIPTSDVRLLSTADLLQAYSGETVTQHADKIILSGISGDHRRNPVVIELNGATNLFESPCVHTSDATAAMARVQIPFGTINPSTHPQAFAVITTISEENNNLSEPEKELLRWHQRLGHIAFSKVQNLFRAGILSNTEATRRLHRRAATITIIPKCAACCFGKQHQRTANKSIRSHQVRDRPPVIRAESLSPGQLVCVDHFVSSIKGRRLTPRSPSNESQLFCGGCIFVDAASGHIHSELQITLSSHDTIIAKGEYELICKDHGIIPQSYLSDNGTSFTSAAFTQHLLRSNQTQRLAGVGAHQQNAVAERAIRTLISISRTMLIHGAMHWPEALGDARDLWPFCTTYAAYIWNHVPDPVTGISPADIWTRTRWPLHRLHQFHVWGCPVYVLDKAIQDGKKIPKWKPRSKRMIYMGPSLRHASNVALCYNMETGFVTPQYHCIFDDWFATVGTSLDDMPDVNSPEWQTLFGETPFQFSMSEEESLALDDEVKAATDLHTNAVTMRRQDNIMSAQPRATAVSAPPPLVPLPSAPMPTPAIIPSSPSLSPTVGPGEIVPVPQSAASTPSPMPTSIPSVMPVPSSLPIVAPPLAPSMSLITPPLAPTPVTPHARPTRIRRSVERLTAQSLGNLRSMYALPSEIGAVAQISALYLHSGIPTPAIYKASHNDPDTLNYDRAMSDTDNLEAWLAAANAEITALEDKDCWDEMSLSDVPANTQILPTTWVFRIKRAPDGTIKKFKARLCARGDLQVCNEDAYAPVVAFSTVRFFLVASLILGWYTCSIDFSNAFVQSSLSTPIYIHVPRGYRTNNTSPHRQCLRLKRSLYGIVTAAKLWFTLLLKALLDLGFTQSIFDPCFLFRSDMFIIIYVDDCGIAAKSNDLVDELLQQLEDKGFQFTREGSFTEFLSINHARLPDGRIELTQSGLIKKIISTAGMNQCNPNQVPTRRDPLGLDPEGPAMKDAFSYPSIVGMLLYLSSNTRPDIAFAVSQVARFTHNPKESHSTTALKVIIRYLKGTINKGLIFSPGSFLELGSHCDADFAGLFGQEPSSETNSARSRSGYVIKLAGCPLLWRSRLMAIIAQSTAEAEYASLSELMRDLLPIRNILCEFLKYIDIPAEFMPPDGVPSNLVFEDNTTALALANNHRLTNRTRHFNVKFHHFWEAVRNGLVEIKYCPTTLMDADYFTKSLPRAPFEENRNRVQGW